MVSFFTPLFTFLVLVLFPPSEVGMAHRVAGCESAGSPHASPVKTAQNPTSTAAGYFQIIDSTWGDVRTRLHPDAGIPPFDEARYHPVWNVYVASLLVAESGWSPWRWSESCWGY